MSTLIDRLHPRPQRAELTTGHLELPNSTAIAVDEPSPSTTVAVDRLQTVLRRFGCNSNIVVDTSPTEPAIEVRIDRASFAAAQAYRLEIDASGVVVVGADVAGAAYGLSTLTQWIDLSLTTAPADSPIVGAVVVEDWPDFEIRGVMLDVSRNRVPTMAALLELVDTLAYWKINQVQLYMEHTFAYDGHEDVWRDADPFTPDEIRQLDRFCSDRCIDLVPNQNSFGHFHRWLIHQRYRDLAECPEGVKHPFNEEPEPFSLCAVDPRALDLLADLYDQLLPNFGSRLFNVGLDETFDLGLGRSAQACKEHGKQSVYLEFLQQVHRLVSARGRTMQFWADVLLEDPSVIDQLPSPVIPLEWGYEADHPFEEHGQVLAATGLPFYFCPGTSSWNSLAGRTTNAFENLTRAARVGKTVGACGYLITDWGDFGHMQPPIVSMPGFLVGAESAWNSTPANDLTALKGSIAKKIDHLVLGSDQANLGALALRLGDIYRTTGVEIKNGSVLFFLLAFADQPLDHKRFDDLTDGGLETARDHLMDIGAALERTPRTTPAADLAGRELAWAAATLQLACDLGIERLALGRDRPVTELGTEIRSRLRVRLSTLTEEFCWLWKQKSREGGLSSSLSRLQRLTDRLE